ncbi:MAG: DNA-binding transcriptional MerR regulator [Salibacteraceae bacterium]|jgi:DNA-binding transcriptional MerR regulator
MPVKSTPVQKMFYPIGEVAKIFDVNTSLIRYWENEFDIIKPKKNKKGNRLFTLTDIDNLKIIYHLVKERGFTLDGAKKKLKENKQDVINEKEIIDHLQEVKSFLLDLKKSLD